MNRNYLIISLSVLLATSCSNHLDETVFSNEVENTLEKIETVYQAGDEKTEFSFFEGFEKMRLQWLVVFKRNI